MFACDVIKIFVCLRLFKLYMLSFYRICIEVFLFMKKVVYMMCVLSFTQLSAMGYDSASCASRWNCWKSRINRSSVVSHPVDVVSQPEVVPVPKDNVIKENSDELHSKDEQDIKPEEVVEDKISLEDRINGVLHAVKRDNIDLLKEMFSEKCADARDDKGRTALMIAASRNSTKCVEFLRQHQAGKQDNVGKTALMHASLSGNVECVKLLKDAENKIRDANNCTALMYAASNSCSFIGTPERKKQMQAKIKSCVELLVDLESGLFDKNYNTALKRAVISRNTNVIDLLAPHEYQPHVFEDEVARLDYELAHTSSKPSSKNVVATKGGTTRELSKKLAKIEYGKTSLMLAVEADDIDIVKKLAKYEIGCVYHQNLCLTALMFAAQEGKKECVEAICEACLEALQSNDPAIKKKSELGECSIAMTSRGSTNEVCGKTALMFAIELGHFDIAKILYPHEYKKFDSRGRDVMYHAEMYDAKHKGQTPADKCVQFLKQCHADLEKK